MDKVEHKGLLYEEIGKIPHSNPRVRRILSMLLDHLIICLSIVPLVIIISEVVSQFEQGFYKLIGNGLFFILLFIYMNKDLLRGKSPAKRIMGYQIIDIKTNKPASEFQCFVRNLTIIGWPIEVIAGLINPQRRLGDFLANTKVITSDKEKLKSMWNDLKNIKVKINFIGILILGGLFFYGLSKLM
ncbi:RDD family protein [uncultured Tenacibaculum sp.]|uniref:RDD family protein n=1 Tax=uncultured Tenacibaculum sp. TaxID=174713 RepID=UPI00262DF72D|nr:RDD family protein [uncultured Tenacibaculum sp.]